MAVPNKEDVLTYLNQVTIRLNKALFHKISVQKEKLNSLKNSQVFKNPKRIYEIKEQKLDSMIDRLNQKIKNILEKEKVRLDNVLHKQILPVPRI